MKQTKSVSIFRRLEKLEWPCCVSLFQISLLPMPFVKRYGFELGSVVERPKGSTKWYARVQLCDGGKKIDAFGQMRCGLDAKAQAEDDLRQARGDATARSRVAIRDSLIRSRCINNLTGGKIGSFKVEH